MIGEDDSDPWRSTTMTAVTLRRRLARCDIVWCRYQRLRMQDRYDADWRRVGSATAIHDLLQIGGVFPMTPMRSAVLVLLQAFLQFRSGTILVSLKRHYNASLGIEKRRFGAVLASLRSRCRHRQPYTATTPPGEAVV